MPFTTSTNALAQSLATRFLGEVPNSVIEQNGGLSGARIWRVESARGTFALRQYPREFPTEERLRWLHGFLKELQDRGCTLLPCPVSMRDGGSWIQHDSHYWELLTWIEGEPLLETNPSRELLIKAIASLANLHLQLSRIHFASKPNFGWPTIHAEGLRQRLELLQQWLARDEAIIHERLARTDHSPLLPKLFALQRAAIKRHQAQLFARLNQACSAVVPIFPVLRDVQPAHVLFNNLQVAGFIDVGAMRLDSPTADLARLLQRWRFAEQAWYVDALEGYQSIRPLDENEPSVLEAYDFSARLLTGVQWLRWLVIEERGFVNPALVNQHLGRVERYLELLLQPDSTSPGVKLGAFSNIGCD